jgi:hypothetical protein
VRDLDGGRLAGRTLTCSGLRDESLKIVARGRKKDGQADLLRAD